jgi:aspartyl-tRNA(Asn)/glutamyl-tRNA(Gln) amidotransferase subunit A
MNIPPRTLPDVARLLEGGALSAEELTSQTLDNIVARNGKLYAFVALDRERALADARHIDALRKLGVRLGPLAGAPVVIKDIIDVAGLPTRAGSLTRADAPSALFDAPIVARLRAAGAIIVGKTHTVEYAFGGWGTNETIGTPLNPRDLGHPRVPGGSSSGSGVAVAAGLCVAALGSDTGGSIRLPASYCGLVGLKTTFGLLDKSGVIPLAPELDTIGPMTNSVADAEAMLQALAPKRSNQRASWLAHNSAMIVRDNSLSGLRVGIPADLGVELHPETSRVFRHTEKMLVRLGAWTTKVLNDSTVREIGAPNGDLLAIEAYRLYGHFAEETPCRLGDPVRTRILAGRAIPAQRLLTIEADRTARRREFAALFESIDAILTPTTATPAPLLGEHDEASTPAIFTRVVNYLGLAALSLPMGMTPEGLPIGMQIIVRGFNEGLALKIGAALEAERGALPLG